MDKIRTNLLLEKIKNMIETEDLNKYVYNVERLIEEDYNSIDISAALLKILNEKSGDR